jgi:hypothetical protein
MVRVVFQATLLTSDPKLNARTDTCGFFTYFPNRGEPELIGAKNGLLSG